MYFTESAHLRAIEKIMREIPNFSPRGHGSIIPQNELDIGMEAQPPPVSFAEFLTATMSAIHYLPFNRRLNQYIRESKMKPMIYQNEKHKTAFEEAIRKKNKKDFALMAALYLFTADFRLWQIMKRYTEKTKINFSNVKLNNIQENGYALFCCAKDLYLDTEHLAVADLADTSLITPKMFKLICNAMAIRRFGLDAIHFNEGKQCEND